MRGYMSADYAESFTDFSEIVTLPRSGIALMKRSIDHKLCDGLGLYPFTSSPNWEGLQCDMDRLREAELVSVAMVVDPFQEDAARDALATWDICHPFKTHWTVDLTLDWRRRRAKNTRNLINKARRLQKVSVNSNCAAIPEIFWELYQFNTIRHGIKGLQGLSLPIIRKQLQIANAFVFLAHEGKAVIGALICIDHGAVAHFHLMALSPRAYEVGTSYALLYAALEHFEELGCQCVNLGGGAGLVDDPADGLYQFKRRWATGQHSTLFAGLVLDEKAYAWLAARANAEKSDFFPAYRTPGGPFSWRPELAPRPDPPSGHDLNKTGLDG